MHKESLMPVRLTYRRPMAYLFACGKPSLLVNFSAEADFEDFEEGDDL